MEEIPVNVWFPVVTLLLGFVAKGLSDWLQHNRAVARDRDARQAEKKDRAHERRTAFQRDTLLALQDAALGLGRATGDIHVWDRQALAKAAQTGRRTLAPDEVFQRFQGAHGQTSLLGARVYDKRIRDVLREFKQSSMDVTLSNTVEGLGGRDEQAR